MPLKQWQKKNLKADLENHEKRMRTIKPMVDNKPPRKPTASNKKELDRKREYAIIEKNNRLLLERLAECMQKKRIDNENVAARKFKRSLADTGKRQELAKITAENYRLLKKIQEIEPTYHIAQWEEDNRRREAYLRNMTEFPERYASGYRGEDADFNTELMGSRPISTRSGRIRPLTM